jgi:translation initiation factor IF-2
MNPEMDAASSSGHRIPVDVAGLDEGRTSYLPADALRGLGLEATPLMGAASGSPKPAKKKPGKPKPPASPKPGSPKPGSPKPPGSPKAKGSPKP